MFDGHGGLSLACHWYVNNFMTEKRMEKLKESEKIGIG